MSRIFVVLTINVCVCEVRLEVRLSLAGNRDAQSSLNTKTTKSDNPNPVDDINAKMT